MKRRTFVAASGAAVSAALLPGALHAAGQPGGSIVLFQGDSITDCGRDRTLTGPNIAAALGTGYPLLVASSLLTTHPRDGLRFYNRGVSGNRVPDLEARWEADTMAIEANIVSILIGVNDFWHTLTGAYHGTVAEYQAQYDRLLARTRQAQSNSRLVVLEPFVLRTGAVTDRWFPEFDQRREAARRVAEGVGALFIPLQAMFDALTATTPPDYWSVDGVHPTPAGHGAIAKAWMDAVQL